MYTRFDKEKKSYILRKPYMRNQKRSNLERKNEIREIKYGN